MAGDLTTLGSTVLPNLRTEITLVHHPIERDGDRYWQLYDPMQHRFFRISEDTARILSIWKPGATFEEMAGHTKRELGLEITSAAFHKLMHFLEKSHLLSQTEDGAWEQLGRKSVTLKTAFNTLFAQLIVFKLPFARPETVLRMLAPFTAWVFTPGFTLLMGIILLAGLYLSAADMLTLVSDPLNNFQINDVVLVGVALVILKSIHEMGHAVTAFRFGSRVPVIGVAFMVFVPLLYTDVTDAWRLPSKGKRLLITMAGVVAEMYAAAIATLLWAFLEDGAARSIAFYIATVGWTSSLIFNMNPFVKFDGYFFVSDLLGIDNLQDRATQVTLWRIRRFFIASHANINQNYSQFKLALFNAYAALSWMHRFLILLTIAFILYSFTAKVFGVVLFFIALLKLLVIPLWKEIKIWRELLAANPKAAKLNRSFFVLASLPAVFFLPLFGQIYSPAVLMDANLQRVFPPMDALVKEVHIQHLDEIKKGSSLIEFEVPELSADAKRTSIELDSAKRQLAIALSGQADRSAISLLRHDIETLGNRSAALSSQIAELSINSRIDGQVLYVSQELRPGNWTSHKNWVALVGSGQSIVIRGYLWEHDRDKVAVGTQGTFIPDAPSLGSIAVTISRISSDVTKQIELPELAFKFGGPIQTHAAENLDRVPTRPVFAVEFSVSGELPTANQISRGTVVLEGRRESLAAKSWRRISNVLIKESVL